MSEGGILNVEGFSSHVHFSICLGKKKKNGKKERICFVFLFCSVLYCKALPKGDLE